MDFKSLKLPLHAPESVRMFVDESQLTFKTNKNGIISGMNEGFGKPYKVTGIDRVVYDWRTLEYKPIDKTEVLSFRTKEEAVSIVQAYVRCIKRS